MILVKYVSKSGILSRRKSEEAIRKGLIRVNNIVIIDPTYEVEEKKDSVHYRNKKISFFEPIYILINKPNGYLTSKEDPSLKPVITELFPKHLRTMIDPVGRLDFNSSGALIFTSDGDFAYSLSHPKFQIKKVYQVIANRALDQQIIDSLIAGIRLEDGMVRPDCVKWDPQIPNHFSIELHSGKYRVIRRLLGVFGIFVQTLHRSSFAGLTVKGMEAREWRYLRPSEVLALKNLTRKTPIKKTKNLLEKTKESILKNKAENKTRIINKNRLNKAENKK